MAELRANTLLHCIVGVLSTLLVLAGCDGWDGKHDEECREIADESRERYLKGDAAGLHAEQLRLRSASIPHDPVFVGTDGTDALGYPLQRPDKLALLRLLRLRRFDDLERWMTYFQDAFAADHRKESWPDAALSAFFNPDPALAPLLDEWVETYPDSFAARAARGNYGYALAMQALGRSETSTLQALGHVLEMMPAAFDFGCAMALRPDFVPAHVRLIGLLSTEMRVVENEIFVRELLEEATHHCPGCYEVRSEYLSYLSPKWGGSYAAMDAYAAGLGRLFDEHPRLRVLLGHSTAERCQAGLSHQHYQLALGPCSAALAHGEDPSYLEGKARALILLERPQDALPLLDRALELSPQNRSLLLTRGTVLAQTDLRAAARDLIEFAELGYTADMGRIVESVATYLAREGQAHFERREYGQAAPYFELAVELLPDHPYFRDQLAKTDARIDPDALFQRAKANPDDLQLHVRVDYALISAGRAPLVLELWNGFIAQHPSVARAYLERSGTNLHLGKKEAGLADLAQACALGSELGCLWYEQRQRGCGRFGQSEEDQLLERSLLLAALASGLMGLLVWVRHRPGWKVAATASSMLMVSLVLAYTHASSRSEPPLERAPVPPEVVVLSLDPLPLGTRMRVEAFHEMKSAVRKPALHSRVSLAAEVEVFASGSRGPTAAKVQVLDYRRTMRLGNDAPEEHPSLTAGHTYVVSRDDGGPLRAFDADGGKLTDEELEELEDFDPLDDGIEDVLREVLHGRELVVGERIRHPTKIITKTLEHDGHDVNSYDDIEVVLTGTTDGIAHLETSMTVRSDSPKGGTFTWTWSGWYEVSINGNGHAAFHFEGPFELLTPRGIRGHGEARWDGKRKAATSPS